MVRAATAADLPQLCEARNNEVLFTQYLDECDGERAHFLVAELREQDEPVSCIAGFGLLYLDATRNGKRKSHLPKLSDLYVATRFRRRGVATALVQAREAIARGQGHFEMYVSIDPFESREMLALASKLGYVALQAEPYATSALHHDSRGGASMKTYFRLDFRKCLI